jgi:hypothetical protein
MPKFVIYYDDAKGDDMAAVERALRAIGPGPVKQDGTNSCFTATLNWGTSAKDLNNWKGKLNGAANIVTSVEEG